MKLVAVPHDEVGNIMLPELLEICKKHQQNLSCLMITYPSTFGVYEKDVKQIVDMIH